MHLDVVESRRSQQTESGSVGVTYKTSEYNKESTKNNQIMHIRRRVRFYVIDSNGKRLCEEQTNHQADAASNSHTNTQSEVT